LSHDIAGDEQSIVCPKCGEKNMAVDVRCWACDAELHPAPEHPAQSQPALTVPAPAAAPSTAVPADYLGAPPDPYAPAHTTLQCIQAVACFILGGVVIAGALGGLYAAVTCALDARAQPPDPGRHGSFWDVLGGGVVGAGLAAWYGVYVISNGIKYWNGEDVEWPRRYGYRWWWWSSDD
jgi:hypothetical protein